MPKLRRAVAVLLCAAAANADAQRSTSDSAILARIRDEGFNRSRVFETAITLSDVYGPRLAGSPQYREAAEWAVRELTSYGLVHVALEAWGTRSGRSWTATRHSIEMTAPRYQRIVALPRAWSPPTVGIVRGRPIVTHIRGDSDLVKYRGKLKGAIILNAPARIDSGRFRALAERFSAERLDSLARLSEPGDPRDYWEDAGDYAENLRKRQNLQKLMRDEGVAVLLQPSANYNAVAVSSYQAYNSDVTGMVPAFVVDRGDYDRLVRLTERGMAPTLEINLETRSIAPVTRADSLGYNVVAELRGSDPVLASQVVMVGGHFDSWTAATGATDNAAGSAIAMEALRILKSVGAQPRRTIRIGLWDGEEHEEYWGSLGYVLKHFGDPETMQLRPEHPRISGYFNIDNGTGRIRGLYLQGNTRARSIFAGILAPLGDLSASTVTIKNVGSTDHMPFNAVGIPAFTFIQDFVDYNTRTHHTDKDESAYLLPDDLKQAAVVVASVLYQVANLPELLPRAPLPPPRKK
jgi:carboxypeptidase Q